MPSKSKSQQRLMGVAYAVKSGSMQLSDVDKNYKDKVKDLVDGMTLKQLKDFAETKHDDLPEEITEGVIKIDLGRILTKISGAIGYKHDPKMRQELLAAFETDIREIMTKHDYMVEAEDYEDPKYYDKLAKIEEANFYNIEPGNIGGMGPISLPGVDNVGSGDIPAGVGSAKDRYEDELEKRKKKNKKKKSILEFSEFVKEQTQLTPFEPKQHSEEELGKGEYVKGPANDPDAEAKERMRAIKQARGVVTFKEFRKI